MRLKGPITFDLPLPSTGRGIEGEGWDVPALSFANRRPHRSHPSPLPLPVEGRGSQIRSVLPGTPNRTRSVSAIANAKAEFYKRTTP
jgi:hypothetical protein